ncbi:MAG: BMC domain-containing protein [Endomicrobia bacterium]|nr:BMC domain-containing protein [Endomicrobiia bacterium]MCX7940482.1 BMC domain-containing protein [Endomicrobiia bacterium]MDW8055109.1 BMC domain-containing protein [Elusimicrobiota bacterium]
MIQPAIGLVELNSIARGIETADAMCKVATIELVDAYAICPGKYVILITGLLADVQSSLNKGIEVAGEHLIDNLLLPNVSPKVIPAILGTSRVRDNIIAVGSIETFTVASCIIASDAAAKKADVDLIEIRLAKGLGGKSYVTVCSNDVGAVRSAIAAGVDSIKHLGALVQQTVIPQIHPDMLRTLL